jgi:chaperonin GroES
MNGTALTNALAVQFFKSPSPTKVIVEKTPEQTHAGALFIPTSARVKPMDGMVVAVGSRVHNLAVGDVVLVEWRSGGTHQFSHDGKDYWLLNERQILAVVG